MRLLFIVILSLVIGCQNPRTNSDSIITRSGDNGIKSKEIIPQEVKDYLKGNFHEWIFPDTSDYHKAWWSFYDKDKIPYFVLTDLNDDSKVDYGLILKNSNSLSLIILVDEGGGTFKHWIFNDFSETYKERDIIFGVNVEPPGRTDCVVKSKEQSLVIKSNGIVLKNFEFKSRIYYWINGDIKVFKVTDRIYI